jgi:hypothetical protein
MAKTITNFDELEKHLNKKFKSMMKSQEMASAGKRASQAMGRHVGDQISDGGASGYDYDQSGDFHKLIKEEARHGEIHQTATSLTMGFGEMWNMNEGVEARRNAQVQDHVVGMNGSRVTRLRTFRLKEENQLPKWVIAEFGMGTKGEGKGAVPKELQVNYTKRPNKEFMYGPSLGGVRGEGGGPKNGFFMLSGRSLMNLLGNRAENRRNFRRHPGIKAGRVFRRGLEKSKEEVQDILRDGIRDYLNNS